MTDQCRNLQSVRADNLAAPRVSGKGRKFSDAVELVEDGSAVAGLPRYGESLAEKTLRRSALVLSLFYDP